MLRPTLTFLGTSAIGVPTYYCGCTACEEARSDPRAVRGCCGLAIRAVAQGKLDGAPQAQPAEPPSAQFTSKPQELVTLIDTSPDLRSQLVRESIPDVERIFYTHEHFDHIGGVAQLEHYVKLKKKQPVPVFAGIETINAIEQQFGFMTDALKFHRVVMWEGLAFEGVSYTFLPATHSVCAFGIVIQTDAKRVAYFPDTAALLPMVTERLEGIDVLILDATFNGNNWMPHSHHSIDQAIEAALSLHAGRTYLTHLAMHYDTPITLAELEAKLAPYDGAIRAAHDGLTIEL